jgi:bacterial/archaeal transporter family protein
MPLWSVPALFGSAFIAVHYLLLRAASGRVDDRLGALMVESSATVVLAMSLLWRARPDPQTALSRAGLGFAAASGVAVAGASVLLFVALRRGGPVASTGMIVLGGGVALSALAAPWLFGESFTARRAAGVVLGLAALWLLGGES